MNIAAPEKPAAHWLNRACALEDEGKQSLAETALKKAIRVDEDEHSALSDPKMVSLPRR